MFFPSRRCLETFHYMVIQLSHNGPGMPNKNESISFPSIYIMILLIFWFNLISCRKGINEVEGKTSTEHPDNVFFFFLLSIMFPEVILPGIHIVEVSYSNTGSILIVSSILWEIQFSALPHSSSNVCRFLLISYKWQLSSILESDGWAVSERKSAKGNMFITAL